MLNQRGVAEQLQAAWHYAQQIREQRGVVVELRLTALGLTAHSADPACSGIATVSWAELGGSDVLDRLLGEAIRRAAQQAKPDRWSIDTRQGHVAA